MIHLVCAGCQQPLQVKPDAAGQQIACPHCRQVNPMPAARLADAAREALAGYANSGHTFGDDLAEQERGAVMRYLKTL
jgi:hypothetical protein